jgi:putative membrane protein
MRRSSGDPMDPAAAGAADIDREHLDQLRKARQRRLAKVIVIVGLLVILAVFVIRNSHPVVIHYVFFSRNTRLIWIMLACAIIGFVVGYLVGRPGKQVRFHGEEK